MIKQRLGLKGHLKVRIKDAEGNFKNLWQENKLGDILKIKLPGITGKYSTEYHKDNLIVNAGLAGIASRYNGDGAVDAFTYIALGTSDNNTDPELKTALVAEITTRGLERAQATTITREETAVANDTAKLVEEFTVTGDPANIAINEVGIFSAATEGTMGSRTVITTKNVDTGDKIEITYTLQVAEA
jgi:hypothetical protein